ncbi:MAG TPA: Ppx/GppA phosphatase family protein [Polyangiaceae bacterium]|nr:Ppx/GppA phosphatase family protein [Polyangiaceae bacterium]
MSEVSSPPAPSSAASSSASSQSSLPPEGTTLAAVDLGSNSFHMVLGRFVEGHPMVLDGMKEMVQLGAGLDRARLLSEASQQRAVECLARFGERARLLPEENVRAVGTNTLRVARNAEPFLERAQRALGHRIEVISGIEEARLIYTGVVQDRPSKDERLLVIDIGGGSTEFIIGERAVPIELESLYMGSIAMMGLHFEDGKINAKRYRRAEVTALQELERIQGRYRRLGWSAAVGSSGTVKAVQKVLKENGWSKGPITREALRKLRDVVLDAGSIEKLATLKGLHRSRANTLPGGVAILSASFEALDVSSLEVSGKALREGLLNDLMLSRVLRQDVRETTVNAFMRKYRVDEAQALRVRDTVLRLLPQVTQAWGLPALRSSELCSWAARLHEIGLDVAHSHYHKHGAYLVAHGDMPGFSRHEQRLLSMLVRGHRRKFPAALWRELAGDDRIVEYLAVLVRLAVVLHRARTDVSPVTLVGGRRSLELRFTPGWLDAHPLVLADLHEEAELLRAGGIELKLPPGADRS